MSDVVLEPKRRRKRRTRAERNKMSRHTLLEQEKQNKLKDVDHSNHSVYMLRPDKAASFGCLGTRDDKKTRAGNITQGRLTRSLGKLDFTNAKSSDWVKRGPIAESEVVKKKVENDLKRILRLAEKSTLTGHEGVNSVTLPESSNQIKDLAHTSVFDSYPMEVDCSSNGLMGEKNSTDVSYQLAVSTASAQIPTTSSASAAVASIPATTPSTPNKSANSSVWVSASSNCADEFLEPEPPVQEIADTIMKELKPKFARMFPNRDIETEMCSDLQKLFNHRYAHMEDHQQAPTLMPSAPFEVHHATKSCTPLRQDTSAVCPTDFPEYHSDNKPRTRLSFPDCQQARPDTDHESDRSMLVQDSVFYPSAASYHGSAYHKDAASSNFTTATIMMPGLPEVENVIRINVNVEESEDEEDDDKDVLSAARYNAFLASARELELQQQKLLQGVTGFDGSACVRRYGYSIDQQHSVRPPYSIKVDDSGSYCQRDRNSNSQPQDWRHFHAARMLDFSHPSSCQHQAAPFRMCNSRGDGDNNLCQNTRVCPSLVDHGNSQFEYSMAEPVADQPCSCLNHKHATANPARRWSSFEAYSSPVCNFVQAGPRVGHSLAQSRLNFQNALKVACRPIDSSYSKSKGFLESAGYSEHLSHRHGRSPSQTHDRFNSRPLSELRGHQADLQRQARDFLDDLNRCGMQSHPDRASYRASANARHLFQIASPDSSGSPVWGIPPLMKDFCLETGGFA